MSNNYVASKTGHFPWFMKMMKNIIYISCLTVLACFLGAGEVTANNIAFLDKTLIKELNSGIYEVVTPKLESDRITYARKLPFDQLDYAERNEKFYSIGTAFFINDRELMTAAHVLPLMYFSLFDRYFIRDSNGKTYQLNMIRKYSTIRDMAVFDLKQYPDTVIPLTLNGEVEIGDTVFSVGNAQGEGIAYRAGQVASFTPEREYGKWKDIRFTSPASPGNSGGPLLNLQGKVVGVIVKKNQSENYNIAVPIKEFYSLGDQAVFHLRNVRAGIYGVDDTLTRDWSFSAQLPATVPQLSSSAQESLNRHFVTLSEELDARVKDRGFPEGERFRDYLRKQSIVSGLAPLVPGKDFKKWNVNGWLGEKIPISADQNVYKTRGIFTDLQILAEKPKDMSLKDFLDSPRAVMDAILQAVSLFRQVGTEKVGLTSLGEPEKTEILQDKLGRQWISSLWNIPFDNTFVYSACLPYPKGALCLFDKKYNWSRKYGYFETIHKGYNEFAVGYQGKVQDWEEYFNLGNKYLPKVLRGCTIKGGKGRLDVSLPEFSIHFKNDGIHKDSAVHLHMGYSNTDLLAEDIIRFEIFPVQGGRANYLVQKYFEPGLYGQASYKVRWKDILRKTGDYSGKTINKGDRLVIRKPFDKTRQIVSAYDGTKIARIFTAGCTYDLSDQDEARDCANFTQSIDFLYGK